MRRKVIDKRTIGTGKWVKLVELNYSSEDSQKSIPLKWEMVERTTKTCNNVDGVDIIAILESSPVKQIILTSQFRPPLDAYCLEFPAGLITEMDETPESAAMRELSEETGYFGYESLVLDEVLFLDPGISNCNMKYVQVAVNPADERNIDPKPDLQDEEEIKTHLVPFNRNLYDSIKDLCSSNGFVLDARLASVALGMKLLPG